ncbi:MAG TPA: heparan-alpha-glucosaminide N-acetyltransferase [Roseiarcus sp.]|nr:heparan-alpha-glucosaminide N-acetyltransferase [Roseiarcus sp.]
MSEASRPRVGPPKTGGRVDAVDVARGLALIAMAAYHLTWDLAHFWLVPPLLPFTPPMRLLSHAIAGSFLGLVGVSLALAHRDRLNLPAFLRRLALVGGGAALVTVATGILFPGLTVWFGILHCIVAASLLPLPLIEAPSAASLAVGAAAIALPFFVQTQAFDPPALIWLGLGEALPNTNDWYPLLPWAGVTLLGLGLARLPGVLAWLARPDRWRARSALSRAIAFAGRYSLAVYLLHQPVLFGLVWAAVASGAVSPAPPKPDFSAFLAACHRSCVAGGRTGDACDASCRCVADAVEESGEAERLGQGPLEGNRAATLRRMAGACMGR